MKVKTALITAIGCLIVGFIAGCIVTNWRLSADATAEIQANADLFAGVSKKVNESAKVYQSNSGQMKSQIAVLKKELNDVQKTNPVPVDCRPDFERMRVIKDAVRAANTAAGQ